ncbi:MAG TPA: hypothetical protein VMY39_02000, partial [Planctomycetota bacterium]|nr:hypothetical protein [Planctomycetota bacterium]
AAAKAWREQGVESPYFKRWFGESKVVNEAGEPLVVYHGTSLEIDSFGGKPGDGWLGTGHYFTQRPGQADYYAHVSGRRTGGTPRVVDVYLRSNAPLIVDHLVDEHMSVTVAKRLGLDVSGGRPSGDVIRDAAQAQGFDSIILMTPRNAFDPKSPKQMEEIVVFEPTQVKSVNNRGTFDPNDARILFQQGVARGVSAVAQNIADAADTDEYYEKLRQVVRGLPTEAGEAADEVKKRTEAAGLGPIYMAAGGHPHLYVYEKFPWTIARARTAADELTQSGRVAPAEAELARYLADHPEVVTALGGDSYWVSSDMGRATRYRLEAVVAAFNELSARGYSGLKLSDVVEGPLVDLLLSEKGYSRFRSDSQTADKYRQKVQDALVAAGSDYVVPTGLPSQRVLARNALYRYWHDLKRAEKANEPAPVIDIDKTMEAFGAPKRDKGVGEFGERGVKDYSQAPDGGTTATKAPLGQFEDFVLDDVFGITPAAGLSKPRDVAEFVPTAKKDSWYERADRRQRGRGSILRQIRNKRDKLGRAWRTEDGVATISDEEYDTVKEFVAMVGTKRLENIALALEPRIGIGISGALNEPLGLYMFGRNVIGISDTALSQGRFVDTTIHELWHGLSQYLPDDVVTDLYKQFVREREAFMRANPGAFSREGELVDVNTAQGQSTYRFSSLDEWVVEKMKDLSIEEAAGRVKSRRMGKGPPGVPEDAPWVRALKALADLVKSHYEQVKAVFGRDVARQTYVDFMQGKYAEQVRNTPLANVIKLSADEQAGATKRFTDYLDALDSGEDASDAGARMSEAAERFIEGMVAGVSRPADPDDLAEMQVLASRGSGRSSSRSPEREQLVRALEGAETTSTNAQKRVIENNAELQAKAADALAEAEAAFDKAGWRADYDATLERWRVNSDADLRVRLNALVSYLRSSSAVRAGGTSATYARIKNLAEQVKAAVNVADKEADKQAAWLEKVQKALADFDATSAAPAPRPKRRAAKTAPESAPVAQVDTAKAEAAKAAIVKAQQQAAPVVEPAVEPAVERAVEAAPVAADAAPAPATAVVEQTDAAPDGDVERNVARKQDYTFGDLTGADAKAFIEDHHYSKSMGDVTVRQTAMLRDGQVVGVAVWMAVPSPNAQRWAARQFAGNTPVKPE